MSFKKRNILFIALMDDFPSTERPVAGTFIKEFVDTMKDSYDCRLMLVRKKFIDIAFRTQMKNLWEFLKTIFSMKVKLKSRRFMDEKDSAIIVAEYPIFCFLGKTLYLFGGMSAVLTARRVLKKNAFKPDLIHAFKSYPSAYIGWKLKQKLSVPVVNVEYQGPFSSYSAEPYRMSRVLNTIRNIDITVHSSFQIDTIRPYGIPDERLGQGHFGIDTDRFLFNEKKYLERKAEISKGKIRLLVIGRVEEEKGIRYLAEAMVGLVKEYPDIRLSLVGSKGNCSEWLFDYCRSNRLEETIKYLGMIERDVLPQVVNEHDIVVVASLYEAFGMTMLEAMSCGKPIVATRCGGPDEVVNEDIGILVSPCDASALADGIRRVITDYSQYDPTRIRGYVLRDYDYRIVKSRFSALYEKLLSEKKKCAV
jgi:glycosyltransferase involved in cell wall biosynthesis